MPNYSVAEAKNTLPRLIDRALAGEAVVITRHGREVVELRSLAVPAAPLTGPGSLDWLHERTMARKPIGITTEELLGLIKDEYR